MSQVLNLSIRKDVGMTYGASEARATAQEHNGVSRTIKERIAPKWEVTVEMDGANEDRASRRSVKLSVTSNRLTPKSAQKSRSPLL